FTVERVSNPARLLSQTAVGLVPSLGSEIICRVAEEFLLCGTPVVAADVGALRECAQGDSGAAYRNEEIGSLQLAAWIRRSLEETKTEKLQRSIDAGRHFNLDAMADHLVDAIRPFLP